jgi:hypothetical protein
LSVIAVLMLTLTALGFVENAYGVEVPDWWLNAFSFALLAVCIWFVGWAFRYFVRRVCGSHHGA